MKSKSKSKPNLNSNQQQPSILSSNLDDFYEKFHIIKKRNSFIEDILNIKTSTVNLQVGTTIQKRHSNQSNGILSNDPKESLLFRKAPFLFTIIVKYLKEKHDFLVFFTKGFVDEEKYFENKSQVNSQPTINVINNTKLIKKSSLSTETTMTSVSGTNMKKCFINIDIFLFKKTVFLIKRLTEQDLSLSEESFNKKILYKIHQFQIVHIEIDYNHMGEARNIINLYINDYDSSKRSHIELQFDRTLLTESVYLYHFLKKYYIQYWQVLYETSLLKDSSQFYQSQFFIKKTNSRGKVQDRIIVITNRFIYNILLNVRKEVNEVKVEDIKWSDSIRSIVRIVLNPLDLLELRVYYDEKINKIDNKTEGLKTLKHKSEREFIFQTKKEKESFIFCLRKGYFSLKNMFLEIGIEKEIFDKVVSKK